MSPLCLMLSTEAATGERKSSASRVTPKNVNFLSGERNLGPRNGARISGVTLIYQIHKDFDTCDPRFVGLCGP